MGVDLPCCFCMLSQKPKPPAAWENSFAAGGFAFRQYRTKSVWRLCTPSACKFPVIFHKNAREYIKYSLRFLFHLTKNLTTHLSHNLCAVLPLFYFVCGIAVRCRLFLGSLQLFQTGTHDQKCSHAAYHCENDQRLHDLSGISAVLCIVCGFCRSSLRGSGFCRRSRNCQQAFCQKQYA